MDIIYIFYPNVYLEHICINIQLHFISYLKFMLKINMITNMMIHLSVIFFLNRNKKSKFLFSIIEINYNFFKN